MKAHSTTLTLPDLARRTAVPSQLRLYALETWYEFLKQLRQPHFLGGVLGVPVLFYLLFGVSLRGNGTGPKAAEYLLATYAVFGTVSAALFGFGVGVAAERASGWMLLKQAAPLPAPAYLAGKILTSMLFGGVIVVLLALLGMTAGGVRFPVTAWTGLLASVMLGSIPFCLFGLALGYVLPPAGAPAVVNLINLPLAFAGGLWLPYEMLPASLKMIAPFVPQHHLGRLALAAVGLAPDACAPHIAGLAAASIVGFAFAALAYRRSGR